MLLLTHITVALLGILQATYALVAPSRRKIRATYGLLAATLATGTYLVVSLHAAILSSCVSGLIYVSVVLAAVLGAQYRLAKQSLGTVK